MLPVFASVAFPETEADRTNVPMPGGCTLTSNWLVAPPANEPTFHVRRPEVNEVLALAGATPLNTKLVGSVLVTTTPDTVLVPRFITLNVIVVVSLIMTLGEFAIPIARSEFVLTAPPICVTTVAVAVVWFGAPTVTTFVNGPDAATETLISIIATPPPAPGSVSPRAAMMVLPELVTVLNRNGAPFGLVIEPLTKVGVVGVNVFVTKRVRTADWETFVTLIK